MEMTKSQSSTRTITITGVLIAITMILTFTPIGMITLPLVSFTIAHIPAMVAAITIGLQPGIMIALSFGLASLFRAATSAASLLDPFFVNPLISVLPRLLIPVTTYFTYRLLLKATKNTATGKRAAAAVAIALGNLTNTFGVYTMLYILYARQILEKSGVPALELIIGAISSTTLIKTIGIVIVSVPVVYAVNKTRD